MRVAVAFLFALSLLLEGCALMVGAGAGAGVGYYIGTKKKEAKVEVEGGKESKKPKKEK